jgi:hypothetical protein
MRPLFTIHSGEYLVGSYIERHFKKAQVRVPSRDTGIDLLVSNSGNRRVSSLQVKFSKDFLVTHMHALFQKNLRACGWWTIDRDKLRKSTADYWVFVLPGFAARTIDFVIIPPNELLRRLRAIHGQPARIQSYIWVTEKKRCWETRGLERKEQFAVADEDFHETKRDLTTWLDNWAPIARLNR